MLPKRYKSTEVDRITWLHVPSGTLWSTSSDTHQPLVIRKAQMLYQSNQITVIKVTASGSASESHSKLARGRLILLYKAHMSTIKFKRSMMYTCFNKQDLK